MCKYSKKIRIFSFIAILLIIVCFIPAKRAAAAGRTIRVGAFELNGFFHKNEDGTAYGYAAEYLDKISEKNGWTYEYVWTENWEESVEYLRDGKVDIIAPAQRTSEREQEFGFSGFNIGEECGTLLALDTNDNLIYEDFSAFSRIKIGCVDTTVFKDDFITYGKNNGFTPNFVSYRDTKAVMSALNSGEIDAALVNLFAKTDTTKVLSKFGVSPFYFMMHKEDTALIDEMDAALQQVKIENPNFEVGLTEKYYPHLNYTPFTKAELEYISSAPVLKVACRSDMKPISYYDYNTGEVSGISRDILDIISDISGLAFEYVAIPTGESIAYDFFREKEIDIIAGVEYNEQNINAPGLRLTSPYLETKKVFVHNIDDKFDVNSKMVLAISTGSQTFKSVIEKHYPNFEIVNYSSIADCFEAVRKGEADLLLQNQYVAAPYLAKPIYEKMVILPAESFDDMFSLSPVLNHDDAVNFAFLNDVRLISILNKSIRQVSNADMSKIIIEKTSDNQYKYTVYDLLYQYRYAIIVIVIILTSLLIIWIKLIDTKRKSMKIITANEERLRNITNNINGGVVVLSASDRLKIVYANDGFLELLNYRHDEYSNMQNREYDTYVHPDDVETLSEVIKMDIERNNQVSIKLRIMRSDGQYVSTLFNGTLTENAKGEREIYCVIMDISEQERLNDKIMLEQQKYSLLIEKSGDIIFENELSTRTIKTSDLYAEKFGWNINEAHYERAYPDVLKFLSVNKEDWSEMEKAMEMAIVNKENAECQARIQKSDGEMIWCRISQYPMVNSEGELVAVLGKILDINKEVLEREELEHKSKIDLLTGLLNKEAFFLQSKEYLKNSEDKNFAMIFLDVDNFKQINDTLGHITGDEAIKETAKKLQVIFSHYDLISRFGGDEFCILLKEIPEETLKDKLEWTVEKLRHIYTANGVSVSSSVSIGAVCSKGRSRDFDSMLECADRALYAAKENGKNQYVLYYEGI